MNTEFDTNTNEIQLSEQIIYMPKSGIVIEKAEINREQIGTRGISLVGNAQNFQVPEPSAEIIYWGADNLLPQSIISTAVDNAITPGLINFKSLVSMSKGVSCFKKVQVDDEVKIKEILDEELDDWLEEIEAAEYCRAAFSDANYLYNVFALLTYNKENTRINKIHRLDASFCRLEKDKTYVRLYNSWLDVGGSSNHIKYNLTDNKKQFAIHSRNYFTGFPHYGFSHWAGSLAWLRFANKIPSWKLAAIQNGMSIKYHVKIPANYFQEVYPDNRLNPDTGKAYTDIDRYEKEKQLRTQIENWLTGSDNAHKTFLSKFGIGIDGRAMPGWEIIVLDDKTKYDAYLEDYNTSNEAVTSAHNVDTSLASINTQGRLSSGSDKKHAFNILTNIVVNEVRELVLKPLNIAKNITFPDKRRIKLGFKNITLVDASVNKTSIDEKQPE